MIGWLLLLAYALVAGLVLAAMLHEHRSTRPGSRRVPWVVLVIVPAFWLPLASGLGLYLAYLLWRTWLDGQ